MKKATTNAAAAKVAIGYCRVSTQGQAEDGVSLDAQEAKIRAWADLNGYELLAVHSDAGISGCRSDRPGLNAALGEACRNRAALVVHSLSRFSRSTTQTIAMSERIDRAGADLVSLSERIDTTSAAGKMYFRLMAVLNEFRRDEIAEKTAAAMQYKIAKGEYIGGAVPFGKALDEDGVKLVNDQAEQSVIATAKALRAEGLTLSAIGDRLAGMGFVPKKGGAWHANTVRRLVDAA